MINIWSAIPSLTADSFWIRMFFRESTSNSAARLADSLFMFIWWISVFFFVLLMGLMILFVIKYRRRPGQAAPRSPSHNTPLEITWTVVPTLILIVIFFWGFWGYMDMKVAPGDAIEMDLTALSWDWQLTYPNGAMSPEKTIIGSKEIPIFVVPEDRPVKLRMRSRDVIHSFWVPDFRTKVDIFPNRYTVYWFQPDRLAPGESHRDHWVFCAEYCGDQHAEMAAILRVVSRSEYRSTIDEWQVPDDLPPAELGERVFRAQGCTGCHSVDGTSGIGPSLKDLYGSEVRFTDGTSTIADEDYIVESIINPSARITAGYRDQMPTYQGVLSTAEINGLVAYIKKISGVDPEEADPELDPEEVEELEEEPEGEEGEEGDEGENEGEGNSGNG